MISRGSVDAVQHVQTRGDLAREDLGHAVVQAELPRFGELHRDDGGEQLGNGGDWIAGVGRRSGAIRIEDPDARHPRPGPVRGSHPGETVTNMTTTIDRLAKQRVEALFEVCHRRSLPHDEVGEVTAQQRSQA